MVQTEALQDPPPARRAGTSPGSDGELPARQPDFLHAVARSCGLGYDSFRKKFAQAMGLSPGRYILTCRMERTRELMQLQQLTNKEIAALLGFYDEFHFSKTFTRLTGMTPRQFRKQHAGG